MTKEELEAHRKNWVGDFQPIADNMASHARYQLFKGNRSGSVPPKRDRLYKALFKAEVRAEKQEVAKEKAKLRPSQHESAWTFKVGKPEARKITEPTRNKDQYKTTVIPDFRRLHVKEEKALLQRKRLNATNTQPEPFVFQAKSRSMRAPPEEKVDWRFEQKKRQKSSSHKHHFSKPNIIESETPNRPAPKTTAKALQMQQFTAQRLRERREREEFERLELEQYLGKNAVCDDETKERVQANLGKSKDTTKHIEKLTYQKKQGQLSTGKRWKGDLKRIQDRVNARPLLMERTQLEQARERARQRALLRVKNTLEEAINTPFCPSQEKFHTGVLRGVRNISVAPQNPPEISPAKVYSAYFSPP
jgi:hypothetical protein